MKPSLAALFTVLLTACPKPSPPPTSILHGMIARTVAPALLAPAAPTLR